MGEPVDRLSLRMSLKPPPSPADRPRSTISVQQRKIVLRDGNLLSADELGHEEEESEAQKEMSMLNREQEWLKGFNTHRTLLKVSVYKIFYN